MTDKTCLSKSPIGQTTFWVFIKLLKHLLYQFTFIFQQNVSLSYSPICSKTTSALMFQFVLKGRGPMLDQNNFRSFETRVYRTGESGPNDGLSIIPKLYVYTIQVSVSLIWYQILGFSRSRYAHLWMTLGPLSLGWVPGDLTGHYSSICSLSMSRKS